MQPESSKIIIPFNNYYNNNNNNNNKTLQGSREKILKILKKTANPSCNKCYGRGYIGWKEDKKTGSRIYIPCPKCINKKNNII